MANLTQNLLYASFPLNFFFLYKNEYGLFSNMYIAVTTNRCVFNYTRVYDSHFTVAVMAVWLNDTKGSTHWDFFRCKVTQKLSHVVSILFYTSSHFDLFKKKNESVWLIIHHDSVTESSWIEKISIVSGDSVFESID